MSEIRENKGKGVEQTTALFRETTGSGKKQHNSSQLTMLSMETPFVFIFIQIYMTSKNNQHSMFCSNQFLVIILNSAQNTDTSIYRLFLVREVNSNVLFIDIKKYKINIKYLILRPAQNANHQTCKTLTKKERKSLISKMFIKLQN